MQAIGVKEVIRVFSFGGGVQSVAALVLAAQGLIDFQTFLFCNVGNDSENPETLEYVENIAKPYALVHNLFLIDLYKTYRDGTRATLYTQLTRPNSRSIGIPVRMDKSGAPGRRSCTYDYKIAIVDKWLRQHGAKTEQAQVGLGISLDEIQRVKPNTDKNTLAWKENIFPLIDEVEKPLTRADCIAIIQEAGLPIPPKSACWFCPFHTLQGWQDMLREQPVMFSKVCELEDFLNERSARLGRNKVWFCSRKKPLRDAIQVNTVEKTEDFDGCDSGYCMI